MREAMTEHIAILREAGEPVPEPPTPRPSASSAPLPDPTGAHEGDLKGVDPGAPYSNSADLRERVMSIASALESTS